MRSPERPFVIVIAVDMSEITDAVLQHGIDAAARRGPADIHVIGVVPIAHGFLHRTRNHTAEMESLETSLHPRVTEVVTAFADSLRDVADWRVRIHIRAGHPVEEILDLVEEVRADLVVMGRHGWGKKRGLIGSVSERVLRHGHCSALLVQPPDYEPAEIELDKPCARCMATRRDSNGEQWFCDLHRDNRRVGRLSVGPGESLQGGWGLF